MKTYSFRTTDYFAVHFRLCFDVSKSNLNHRFPVSKHQIMRVYGGVMDKRSKPIFAKYMHFSPAYSYIIKLKLPTNRLVKLDCVKYTKL